MTKKTDNKIFTRKLPDYVREVVTPAGSHLLRIEIRKYGQTFRKSIKVSDFETPSDALECARITVNEMLTKMKQGYTVSGFPTVKYLYEQSFVLFPLRIKTRQRHDVVYRNLLQPYADLTIDKVTTATIQQTVNEYAKTHSKEDTRRVLTIWKRLFKVCAHKEINIMDKTVAIVFPECPEAKHRSKDISSDDLNTFCNELLNYNIASVTGSYRSHAIYYAIQIMKYCGTRPAETFALLKSDVNLAKGYISITKASRSTQDSILDISKAKTEKSKRNVPIPPALIPILMECMEWSRNDLLLSDYYGNLMDIDDIDVVIANVRKKAKVNFNLYMLRHQFSTDLMTANVPPNIIRDLMGHESATMSLEYATSNEKDRKNAISNRIFS